MVTGRGGGEVRPRAPPPARRHVRIAGSRTFTISSPLTCRSRPRTSMMRSGKAFHFSSARRSTRKQAQRREPRTSRARLSRPRGQPWRQEELPACLALRSRPKLSCRPRACTLQLLTPRASQTSTGKENPLPGGCQSGTSAP